MSLLQIDSNILHTIFDHLDRLSLSRVACTCTRFNEIAIGNNFILWKKFVPYYQKNDVYNWYTLAIADQLSRSLFKNPIFLCSEKYGDIQFIPRLDAYVFYVHMDYRYIRDLLIKKYKATITYDGVEMDDDNDIPGVFADLLTNYGFVVQKKGCPKDYEFPEWEMYGDYFY